MGLYIKHEEQKEPESEPSILNNTAKPEKKTRNKPVKFPKRITIRLSDVMREALEQYIQRRNKEENVSEECEGDKTGS